MDTFEAMLARHAQDSSVLLAGDWHGNLGWALQQLERNEDRGGPRLVLHLGDFSIWPGNRGKKFLYRLNKKCEEYGVDFIVTLGNHEDWARVTQLWRNPKRQDEQGRPLPLSFGDHVWVLPRGWRFEVNGVSFLSVGGAASVDFDVRTRDRDWWMEEMVTWEDVAQACEPGYADVLLTHETPNPPYCAPQVERILSGNPMGFSLEGLAYSKVSRNRITKVLETVKPRLHAHGHMHAYGMRHFYFPDEAYRSTVLSLEKDLEEGNLLELDLARFKAEDGFWPQRASVGS